ncbi:MAG: proline--tRNA ligase [Candidatus Aenigmarchaeota archaeon]|nr:proline--tRNA ligase [Candidatus Aenigmarchaeota archaeon]
MSEELGITVKKKENFDEWYIQTILRSELADYSDVSGCLILRPDAYFIWEQIQKYTDKEFKKVGIKNVYFPLFIPEKLLNREKEHVEGFNPEVAWVTYAGERELDERLAVRPTSETIMYPSYSKWIRSWRDMPLRFNQWNNVVRWEFKHAVPFLRTREFLWNEGHTVFATEKEALAEQEEIVNIYKNITENVLAIPSIIGNKTEKEKFAGAVFTIAFEHMLPDGRAIQGPDFHHDGQKFAKAFDITFLDKKKERKYAWQNTFAISTREIGVMISLHSDDKGLVLPPKVALTQVVIVPIYKTENRNDVLKEARKIENTLSDFRTQVDDRDGVSPGFKFNEWELKGVPIRLEIGPKDIEKKQVVLVRRDTGKKSIVKINNISKEIENLLDGIHSNLLENAKKIMENHTHIAKNYDDLKEIIKTKMGMVKVCWCGEKKCEEKIKEDTTAKIITIPLKQENVNKCICCGKKAKYSVLVAKTY